MEKQRISTLGLIGLLVIVDRPQITECQVFSWTVPEPLTVDVCSGDTNLYLNWTYTPSDVSPVVIEWAKLNDDGTVNTTIASDTGMFTPKGSYIGRVSKTGSTAEIAISNLTAADAGLYSVSVTDDGGLTLDGRANISFSISAAATLESSGVTATCTDNTVTCSGVLTHGSPAAALIISYGSFSDSTTTDTSISTTLTSQTTVTCQLSGPAADCASGTKSDSVLCGPPGPDLECIDRCDPLFIAFTVVSSLLLVVFIILVIKKVVSGRTTLIALLVVAIIVVIVALVFIIVTVVLSCAPGECASLAALIPSAFAIVCIIVIYRVGTFFGCYRDNKSGNISGEAPAANPDSSDALLKDEKFVGGQ